MLARAEQGDFVTRDRLGIGVSEDVIKQLLDAGLPREADLAGKVRVRVETARPLFRGNNAALIFQASARSIVLEGAAVRLELGGSLERVRIRDGRLVADVQLNYWNVLDTSLGDLGAGVLDRLIRQELPTITGVLPTLEIPVRLEQSVRIDGLNEGPVTTRPGILPLEMTVAEVLPVRERLWVFLDARVGPWQALPTTEAGP